MKIMVDLRFLAERFDRLYEGVIIFVFYASQPSAGVLSRAHRGRKRFFLRVSCDELNSDFGSIHVTQSLARSICTVTVTCKWTYLAYEKRWNETYFERSV